MKCRNCRLNIGEGRWCLNCFRAYTIGAVEMLGGLTASGAIGVLVWWWSS